MKNIGLNYENLDRQVYQIVKQLIEDRKLLPGEKIVDKELAEHMGVSRTPVREALRRLEDKGLVESSANLNRTTTG